MFKYLRRFLECQSSKRSDEIKDQEQFFKQCRPLVCSKFKVGPLGSERTVCCWSNFQLLDWTKPEIELEQLQQRLSSKAPASTAAFAKNARRRKDPDLFRVAQGYDVAIEANNERKQEKKRTSECENDPACPDPWANAYDRPCTKNEQTAKFKGKAPTDMDVYNRHRGQPWFSEFCNLYSVAKNAFAQEPVAWHSVQFVSTTVLVQARDTGRPAHEVWRDFVETNIGASDFARHITLNKKRKGEVVKWLFRSLIKRPHVQISRASFSTTKKLTDTLARELLTFNSKTAQEKLALLLQSGA